MKIKIPLGIEDFGKIREGGYFYADKTSFIKELLEREFEATLITRPRRFGKTLTMSMLEDFLDICRDSRSHFDGLAISKETGICEKWMNQWPVVFLSLKSVEGLDFRGACERLKVLLANVCKKYAFLEESDAVDPDDKAIFQRVKSQEANRANLMNSLALLTRMMHAHYGKQAILLVDEYDVPVAKANERGYYAEMVDLVRGLLGDAVKTNPYLKLAVITGCLRIARESIFTGLNNFVVDSVTADGMHAYVGFTPEDVARLLEDTGFSEHAADVKAWYDGYRFGRSEIYCPWDVLNYISALRGDPGAKPGNYWGNTSSNAVIRQFIDRKDLRENENINEDMETLIAGGIIRKPIREDLTYDTLHASSENFWSLLLLTGYLTMEPNASAGPDHEIALRIPNEEVRMLFRMTVREWFADKVKSGERTELFHALWSRDAEESSQQLSAMVYDTISYYDYKEDFYRAFMAGILSYAGYELMTNKELGEGRLDIVLKDERNDRAMVIEIKWTQSRTQMKALCDEALRQIRDRRYAEGLEEEFGEVICCGVCFFKKRCMVCFDNGR